MCAKIIAYFAFVCVVVGQDGSPDCTTPIATDGHCISLLDCEKLKPMIHTNRDHLIEWHCGYDKDIPMVCCPIIQSPPNDCITIEGKPGACIALASCPVLSSKLQMPATKENIAYVQRSRCIGKTRFDVCCERNNSQIDPNILTAVFNETNKEPFIVVKPTTDPVTASTDDTLIDKTVTSKKICGPTATLEDPGSGCCGVDSTGGNKIIGGSQVALDGFPWLVLIEYSGRDEPFLCGGSLISSKYVLTAAHCVVGQLHKAREVASVRVGEYNITNEGMDCVEVDGGGIDCTNGSISIPIESVIVHPEYNRVTGVVEANDIALIRLKEMAPYSEFIRPVCLPQSDITKEGPPDTKFYVAGWGAVSETEATSSVKLQVDLPLINHEDCRKQYSVRKKTILWDKQICAGGDEGKDTCKGDSGGPMTYWRNKYQEVIGVTSFGVIQCGSQGKPSIYTKVYDYIDWIKSNVVP